MLKLCNVSSGYTKENVICDISLNIEKGILTGITGPNGCGKSTLLKTVMKILPQRSGTITVCNQDISTLNGRELAKTISYLPQKKPIHNMTVEQMVLHGRFPHTGYPRRYSQNDVSIAHNAMKIMGVDRLADRLATTLSGGMQQNANIAMAIAQDTDFVLLDEPTAHLDIANSFQLMDTLKDLATKGKGMCAVLHDITLAMEFCDRIVIMDKGRIVAEGIPADLYNSQIFRNVFGVKIQRIENKNGYSYYYER